MIRYRSGHFIVIALLLCVAACAPPEPAAGPSSPSPTGATAQTAQTPAQAPAKPRPYIGANIGQIELPPNQSPTGQADAGRVEFVLDDTPAQAAGLTEGDIILSMNGTVIDSAATLIRVETSLDPGATVPLVILRDGRQRTLTVQLGAYPPDYDARQYRYIETRVKSEQQAADDAERAGDSAQAFGHLVRALRLLFFATNDANIDSGLYLRLLDRIATVLPKLRSKPAVPSEADRHNRRALALLHSAASPEDNDRAAEEYRAALYEAPWIADLYFNMALALEKAGTPENAIMQYRNYLVLNPAPRDHDSIKQKLADLEVLADERKPWLRFATTWPDQKTGAVTRVTLRDRNLTVTAVKAAPDFPLYADGAVMLSAVIHGRDFTGKWHARSDNPDVTKCYGADYDVDAFGGLDPSGTTLTINERGIRFNAQSCQETGTQTSNPLTYHITPTS